MKEYHKCKVSHKPEHGFYGDCLRACVASIIGAENPETVPHFFQDGCDGVEGEKRLNTFLNSQGLGDFRVYYDASTSLQDILEMMESATSEGVHYLLYCKSAGNDHVVIGCGNKIVHDPAWYISRDYSAGSSGYWVISVFVKL